MHLIGSVFLCGCYFERLLGTKQPPEKGKERRGRGGRGQGLPDECKDFHRTFDKHPTVLKKKCRPL